MAHWHITQVTHVGEPHEPRKVVSKYKTVVGALIREHIPIKYRKWLRKDDDP
jgi:hypothetical protein